MPAKVGGVLGSPNAALSANEYKAEFGTLLAEAGIPPSWFRTCWPPTIQNNSPRGSSTNSIVSQQIMLIGEASFGVSRVSGWLTDKTVGSRAAE
jgi:hypothetical protein